nr:TetR/AcrR family transcriptional regulator [Gordonia humi]
MAAATSVLERDGHDATLSSIAEEAGVGIGTLYRHFPNRGRLVEAVYRNRVVELCEAAPTLLAGNASARDALHIWAGRFGAMLVANRDVPASLQPALSSDSEFREESSSLLTAAVQDLLDAGISRGEIRSDVAPIDILRMVTGFSYVATSVDDITRPLDIMVDGLRPS